MTSTTSSSAAMEEPSGPFLDALRQKRVSATVMHLDHYRAKKVSVGTDYIILVQPMNSSNASEDAPDYDEDFDYFDAFTISKTYKNFRTFSNELTTITNKATAVGKLKPKAAKLAKYVELVTNLIESQKQKYLGKVSYGYVKALAKQRSQIINGVLEATCEYYPPAVPNPPDSMSDIFMSDIASAIETFFLTDHCAVDGMHAAKKKTLPQPVVTEAEEPPHPLLNPLMGFTKGLTQGVTNNIKKIGHKHEPQDTATETAEDEPMARASIVVTPITMKERRSEATRAHDREALEQMSTQEDPNLWLDDYYDADPDAVDHSYVTKTPPKSIVKTFVTNPLVIVGFLGAAVLILSRAASFQIQVDADWAFLIVFAAYCVGYHTPKVGINKAPPVMITTTNHLPDRSGRKLIRRTLIQTGRQSSRVAASQQRRSVVVSTGTAVTTDMASEPRDSEMVVMNVTDDEEELEEPLAGPMSVFPEGAELGSILNCWGPSAHQDFQIRGPNYLQDRKKIPSKDFLLSVRGIDLYLTDTCPSNVGSHPAMFAGALREVPTFIINFRLPWGVLAVYCEIPPKFVPYIQACYEPEAVDREQLEAALKGMSPGERCACRFFMKDDSHKNKTLKIVPFVVKGPWVVRQVVGGKPAIIGNKLPINYVYQKAEEGKAMYLEADLDIAASSAARGILSVARTYTQVLTLDLGFVVQGNVKDELPEQMLLGCRLHGVDPLSAPSYPPAPNDAEAQELLFGSNTGDVSASSGGTDEITDGKTSTTDGTVSAEDDASVTPMPEPEKANGEE